MNCYDTWNRIKKQTASKKPIKHFNEGDIWWARVGINIGTETLGKGSHFARPVLILRKFYPDASLIIPLSSNHKTGNYYFNFKDTKDKNQCALLAQVRYLDTKRFDYRLARISKEQLKKLKEAYIEIIKNNPTKTDGGH